MLEEGRAREEGEARRAEAEQAREDAEEMAVQAGQREDEVVPPTVLLLSPALPLSLALPRSLALPLSLSPSLSLPPSPYPSLSCVVVPRTRRG